MRGKCNVTTGHPISLCGFFIIFYLVLALLRDCSVLGPLGSGTDATHQPGPTLRLLGFATSTLVL